MNQHKGMLCYYPTTVVLVDDKGQYLDSLKANFKLQNIFCKAFTSSPAALDFLVNQYKVDTFINRCLDEVDDPKLNRIVSMLKYDSIYQEIYRPHRFEEMSVLVVDYAMPDMNGVDLCRQLRLKGPALKIIMLTGEAGKDLAVDAFNEGIIDKFILKDAENLPEALVKSIRELQINYFQKLSSTVLDTISASSNKILTCLSEPKFITLFNSLLENHKITEYYLLDESGSYLFVDRNGKPSWLIVKTEDQMKGVEFELNLDPISLSADLEKAIHNRDVLRHCFNDKDFPSLDEPEKWEQLFYPATKLMGKENYYYSYIEKPMTMPVIDLKKIVSFNSYQKNKK